MRELNRIHLSGLRAIESVGRLGSLAGAAKELGVTAGAVSQRINKTEEALKCKLFIRTSKGLVPNEIGEKVLHQLTDGMASLASAVSLADRSLATSLTVSVMPVFANRWLVWQLPRFTALFPHVHIQIDSDDRDVHPEQLQTDLRIRFGKGSWPGVEAEPLLEQRVFPVCSPDVAARLAEPNDLRSVPIIRGGFLPGTWDMWLHPYEMTEAMLSNGPKFTDPSLCLDAAMSGQGVYMASEILACRSIELGHLVEPFDDRRSTGFGLWSIVGRASAHKKDVMRFKSWLKEEMSRAVCSWRKA